MDGHLSKPFTLEGLLEMIRQAPMLAAQRPRATAAVAGIGMGSAWPSGTTVGLPQAPGSAVLMFNRTKFERTAVHPAPRAVLAHLETLAEEAENLLSSLLGAAGSADALGGAAHALACTAGMFGFDHLGRAAGDFEHSIDDLADASAQTDDLVDVLKLSLDEMRACRIGQAEICALYDRHPQQERRNADKATFSDKGLWSVRGCNRNDHRRPIA